jgi:hypothetical protein
MTDAESQAWCDCYAPHRETGPNANTVCDGDGNWWLICETCGHYYLVQHTNWWPRHCYRTQQELDQLFSRLKECDCPDYRYPNYRYSETSSE